MMAGCTPPKPAEPYGAERTESKFTTTSCQTSSVSHGEQLTGTRSQKWYYHIEDKPYTACCDEKGNYTTVKPEYKTGWYTEDKYCEDVIKPILVSFGILNEHVTVLSTNLESRKISAGYNLQQFFKDRPISDDILKTLETSYYNEICKDATNMLSGSGRVDPVNIEFDIVLTFTGVGEVRALLSYLRAKSFAQSAKLFASRTSEGVELLAKEGGEKVALYADNTLKEIKYIDEGGEILGSTGKIKILEQNGSKVESVLQIVRKDGQIGFKKITNVVKGLVRSWDEAVKAVDDLIKPQISKLKKIYPDAKMGYRGSLATGKKYSTSGPFEPTDWDVDAFIVSDELAAKIGNSKAFRDGRLVTEVETVAKDLEKSFVKISGYRTEIGKPFTFRVWTKAEFEKIVKPNGYKLFE